MRTHSTHALGHVALCLTALALSGCQGCQDDLKDIVETCESTPDSTYLVSVRNVDFDAIGTKELVAHARNLNICQDHFAASTPAGHQVSLATEEINDLEGVDLSFTRTWVSHANKATLFTASPADDWFDYVDNALDLSADHPCHADGSILCSDTDDADGWAMNTCRFNGSAWGGSGDTDYFTVSANVYCYDHATDPSSDDHPNSHGVLHELAHGFGMNHTSSWAEADKQYMSTMQGKHVHLTSLDVAFLRERYPKAMPEHRNYVASSKTRFDDGAGGWDARVFWEDNPSRFYVDAAGKLKDCTTRADPELHVAWFNTGDLDGESGVCGVNRLFLREKTFKPSPQAVELFTWKIATMPSLSQDQWKGTIAPSTDDVAKIAVGGAKTYELVFQVNAWGTLDESTDADNELAYDVEIFGSSSCL
jgi:hypothetical protein